MGWARSGTHHVCHPLGLSPSVPAGVTTASPAVGVAAAVPASGRGLERTHPLRFTFRSPSGGPGTEPHAMSPDV